MVGVGVRMLATHPALNINPIARKAKILFIAR